MISLYSALAIKMALAADVLSSFSNATGTEVDVLYDPTTELTRRVREGARPHVMIAVTSSFEDEAMRQVFDLATRVRLAKVGVGLAVPPGSAKPDISTVDALRATLLNARSVAYSRAGASGIFFRGLLERLGVAEEVDARATVLEKGFTATAVVDGRADLAVQQLSELMFVPGAEIVGPLPEAVQQYTELSACLSSSGGQTGEARALLGHLAGVRAAESYARNGLSPLQAASDHGA